MTSSASVERLKPSAFIMPNDAITDAGMATAAMMVAIAGGRASTGNGAASGSSVSSGNVMAGFETFFGGAAKVALARDGNDVAKFGQRHVRIMHEV